MTTAPKRESFHEPSLCFCEDLRRDRPHSTGNDSIGSWIAI